MKRLAEAALLAATILIGTDCAAQEVAYPDIVEQWRQDNKDRWKANMESLTVKDGDLSSSHTRYSVTSHPMAAVCISQCTEAATQRQA